MPLVPSEVLLNVKNNFVPGNHVKECLAKTHDCSSSEICINKKPGYDCICDDYSIRIEGKCIDIDECVINDPCNPATRLGTETPADLIHRRCANIEGPPGKYVT